MFHSLPFGHGPKLDTHDLMPNMFKLCSSRRLQTVDALPSVKFGRSRLSTACALRGEANSNPTSFASGQ